MKINQLIFCAGAVSIGLLSLATGCGKGVTGTYTINQIQTAPAMMSMAQGQGATNCQSTQATLNLMENNQNVSGNAVNNCFSETLTGTHSGDGQITGVTLTMIPMNSYPQYGGAQGSQNCVYNGTISVDGSNRLNSYLQLNVPAQNTQGQPGQNGQPNPSYLPTNQSNCSPTLMITGQMSG
jgi:hypothetical protein